MDIVPVVQEPEPEPEDHILTFPALAVRARLHMIRWHKLYAAGNVDFSLAVEWFFSMKGPEDQRYKANRVFGEHLAIVYETALKLREEIDRIQGVKSKRRKVKQRKHGKSAKGKKGKKNKGENEEEDHSNALVQQHVTRSKVRTALESALATLSQQSTCAVYLSPSLPVFFVCLQLLVLILVY